jgi:hypothetical protein
MAYVRKYAQQVLTFWKEHVFKVNVLMDTKIMDLEDVFGEDLINVLIICYTSKEVALLPVRMVISLIFMEEIA